MNNAFLQSRATKFSAFTTVYILIVLGVLCAANFLANRYNKSIDTTSNKRYSLSDQTVKVVTGLKADVTISYFDDTTNFPRAKDLLDRYDNLSTKLKVDYIDPFKKPQLAKEFGINQAGAILLTSGSRRQEARSVTEEELTSAMVRLFKSADRTVCLTAGAGEHSLEDNSPSAYTGLKALIEKNNYKTQVVNLLEKPEISAGCTALVVGGPHIEYPQPVADALKRYVEGGGRALFLTDPPLVTAKETISENAPLIAVLQGWGVTVEKNLILDASGVGQLYGMGPEFALATKYESHPIVREMKRTATAFPLVRSLTVKPTDRSPVEKLVSTAKNSLAVTNLNATKGLTVPKGDTDEFTIAAAGVYRPEAPKDAKPTDKAPVEGRFVVVGSSDWVANYALGKFGNADLFLNMINWLSNDEDLISIRPKDPEDRRIQLTRPQMLVLRAVSQFLIPIGIILLGVMVWWRRR